MSEFSQPVAQGGSEKHLAETGIRRRARRGMYILPSVFTSGNIALGFYAITQSLQGSWGEPHHFDKAALAIGFAIPFDAIDGRVARMTHTESDFGKELDSLADVITFGVAPSILAYAWGFRMLPLTMDPMVRHRVMELGAIVCFLFLICGASRLARFNISNNPVPKNPGRPGRKYFVGMPIPSAAGVLAASVHLFLGNPIFNWWLAVLWMGVVGLIGFLMVCTWRFWSGKEIQLGDKGDRHPFQVVILLGALIVVVALFHQYMLAVIAFLYMFSGIFARMAYSWQRRRQSPGQSPGPRPTLETGSTHTA